MLAYPEDTIITLLEKFRLLVWQDGSRWYYRVNEIIEVRGVVIDASYIGSGWRDTQREAEDCAAEVHRLALAKSYAVD